jgi:hypothetical protein
MKSSRKSKKSVPSERGQRAESLLADIFEQAGWRVEREPDREPQFDMKVHRPGVAYVVEVKAAVEGRGDRLVPLFSQAILQSLHSAGRNAAPLAVVAAPKISQVVAEQVLKFAEQYAPDVAVGVIDFEGLRMFRGAHLEELNAEAPASSAIASKSKLPRFSGHLFSDLNQWMLKVLLAPEVPEELLSAPREQYINASQLAEAAKVSMMSAFRFVDHLKAEGYLSESDSYLNLVRREDLFRRWQASAVRSVKEVPMRYLLKGNPDVQLRKIVSSGHACLAMFAAAEVLKLGFVEGVPPYVYVERIRPPHLKAFKNLRQCEPDEFPDLILRQAPAPQSVFRGLVRPDGVAVCDVLQVWLDVSSHPSRGREQADLIRRKVLGKIIEGKR